MVFVAVVTPGLKKPFFKDLFCISHYLRGGSSNTPPGMYLNYDSHQPWLFFNKGPGLSGLSVIQEMKINLNFSLSILIKLIQVFYKYSGGSDNEESVLNAGDLGSIPGSGRSLGEWNGNPLQYSSLENPMDRGVWRTTVHGVAKSRT